MLALLCFIFFDLAGVGSVHSLVIPHRLLGTICASHLGREISPSRFFFASNSIDTVRRLADNEGTASSPSDNDDDVPPGVETPKRDPDVPKTWNAETTPFAVVGYYKRYGVTEEQIKSRLAEHEITSLGILNDRLLLVTDLIDRDCIIREILENISTALKRSDMEAFGILGGFLMVESTCIASEQLDLYTEKAVSFTCRGARSKVRYPNFSLVMGPSGSGKTMFALKYLPKIANSFTKDKEIFIIHVAASSLIGNDRSLEKDLPALLVNHVQLSTFETLEATFGTVVPPPMDLFLFVVIDEAGRSEYKSYFDEGDKIQALVTALRRMRGYRFTKGVHVAVVGTALATTTRGIDSNREALKYHMQPWSSENFHALLGMLNRADETNVKRIVERFHILNSLTTNARCAYFLADSMPTITTTNKARWAGYVVVTFPNAARRYIDSNGLSELVTSERKFIVAQEAFKAVDQAIQNPNDPKFPKFDHIEREDLRTYTQSLLDVNLDLVNGVPALTEGSKYSISMTAAIAVVLAELLCEKARVCWDWRDFENAAALGEWKTMITDMHPSDFTDESGIIRLRSALPARRAEKSFSLPLVDRSTVLLNGPNAPYADVIAPFRLLQAKFSSDPGKVLKLDFEKEMGKMGLTNSESFRLQQATSSVLYLMWLQILKKNDRSAAVKIEQYPKLKYREDVRCEHFPYQTLLSGDIKPDDSLTFLVDQENEIVKPSNESRKQLSKQPTSIKILEDFTENHPVTAVFATNVDSIMLQTVVPKLIVKKGTTEEQKGKISMVSDGTTNKKVEFSCQNVDDEDFGCAEDLSTKNMTEQVSANGSFLKLNQTLTYTIGRDDVDFRGVLKKPLPDYLVRNLRKNVDLRFVLY